MIEMAILPTAMTDAITKLLNSMTLTGSRVVPAGADEQRLVVGLEEQRRPASGGIWPLAMVACVSVEPTKHR